MTNFSSKAIFLLLAIESSLVHAQNDMGIDMDMDMGMDMGMETDDIGSMDMDLTGLEPCLDIDSLEFPSSCNEKEIFQYVKGELKKLRPKCTHNARTEMMLLARVPNFREAKYVMRNKCLGIEPCIEEWEDFGVAECNFDNIVDELTDYLPEGCPHDATKELELFFGSKNLKRTKKAVKAMCSNAWKNFEHVPFSDIDNRFTDDFMSDYVAGDTFLNTETGEFGGTEVGENIDMFREDEAAYTVVDSFTALSRCNYNSMMCCFGRDRQPNDDNGNCADPIETNCVDADPADNSNLCFTDFDDEPYPGESENDIHCHGLAWADDSNDATAQLRFNNFFYVSLYDHMYQRGYVENMVDKEEVPMCGCIEEMQPVSRSDCTEIQASTTFTISYGDNGLTAYLEEDDFEVDFASCNGINPNPDEEQGGGDDADNDLASYVHRLYLEGKMKRSTQNEIFKVLVGYANPDDNENEEACARAYELETGLEYPEEE